MTRATALTAFVAAAGWAGAARRHLAGDASDRRYERLTGPQGRAVLMDNPPGGADDPVAFAAIAAHLAALGLSSPRILAADLAQGFLLLEDLGDDLFARLPAEPARYAEAARVLAHLQAAPPPPGLPDLTVQVWAEAAALAVTAWGRGDAGDLTPRLAEALMRHGDGRQVLILRDYHAENLLWLPDRAGLARVGLLDFQLAQRGQPVYDLVSLTSDARRDVPADTVAATHRAFAEATGAAALDAPIAVWGAQRALRILGVFARLATTRGKTGYLALMPRVWGQLQRHLEHPALAPLRDPCARLVPEPTPDRLEALACGR